MTDIMRLERAYEIGVGVINRNNQNKVMREHLSLVQLLSDVKFVLNNLKEKQRS